MPQSTVFCCFTNLYNRFALESMELISLWEKSWSDHGWNTVVLTRSDAMKHPLYTERLWDTETNIMYNSNPKCPHYTRTCYERWFAYSVAAETHNIIHWADYDVINYGYKANEAIDEACKFDPSYCCGVLTKGKSEELIANIINYAFMDKQEFDKLNLTHNNDMCLLDKLKMLPLHHICSNPINFRVDFRQAKLTHFHGGVSANLPEELGLKTKTRLEVVQALRPYE